MGTKNQRIMITASGVIIGIIAVALVVLGNPANMGFCIACFIRDTAGGLGLHRAEAVQYIRPEIIGLIIGSWIVAVSTKEFKARGGSSPITRFTLGFFVMIGCLMFLGCPFRMILRLAGGDLNALFGLAGFAVGIGIGVAFLRTGYTLKRTYSLPVIEGLITPATSVVLLVLVIAAPTFIFFSAVDAGPGGKHASIAVSLIAGLIVGVLAQRTRLCMVGGIRDLILFKETKLIIGFASIFVAAFIGNLIIGKFNMGFADQPVAHTDGLWNMLGMLSVGLGCTLLGGCPLRQLIMTGEGNTDSAITILGLLVGAAFCHNFGLASSGKGPTVNGKIGVIIGIIIMLIIAIVNTKKEKE